MRQGQQNRRGRGRNNNNNNGNNNRKSQNPLTRSFESTGPDVKVRGTPAHVAEKYISLARDALSSGDRVLAENYLQHAEHYNRIILTYREQQMSQGGEFQGGHLPRVQTFNAQDPTDGDEFGDEEGDDLSAGGQPQAGDGQQPNGGQGQNGMPPQRQFDGQQRYDNRQRHDNRGDHRQHNQQRHDRDGNRFDRGDRQDRGQDRGEQRFNRHDRNDNRGDRGDRFDRHDRNQDRNQDREPREFREDRGSPSFGENQTSGEGNGNGRPPRRERFAPNGNGDRQPYGGQPQPMATNGQPPATPSGPAGAPPLEASDQPAFLRRPVRRPRREEGEAAPQPQTTADETE